jgi:TonB dependent receptor/Carboxypeptidase regulatory-like domain
VKKPVSALCLLLFVALVALLAQRAVAESAGIVTGVVTDADSKAPVAGIAVKATSPSATYTTVTDDHGHYSFLTMLPDNYAISFTGKKYLPYSTAIVVLPGSQQAVNASMSTGLRTIASTHSRRSSAGSAFQRGMTIDTYTVTGAQIDMVQGKSFNNDETQLLRSIPSITIDKSGTISIRGGFAFEAAYEFEGIDYTTPNANLQNTQQNVGNFGLLNGVGSVQLIPGGGDATHGATGTGLVVFTAKHGTYPSFLNLDVEALMYPYLHQFGLEWGWADPQQRLSNYVGFIGVRRNFQYGTVGTAANSLGTLGTNAASLGSTIDPNLVYYAPEFLSSNDLVDNLIYRFGKDQRQRLQFFIQSQSIQQNLDYGGIGQLPYISGGSNPGQCSPFPVIGPSGPVNSAQQQYACKSLIPLYPGQPNTAAFVSAPDTLSSPFLAYKLEYGANIGTSSLLTMRFFQTRISQTQEMPAQGILADPFGGTRTGGTLDMVSAIGSKNLLKFGTTYEFARPFGDRSDFTSYTAFTVPENIVTFAITHPNQPLPLPYTFQGLLPNNNPAAQQGLEQDFFSRAFCAQLKALNCGYLAKYFPGGVRFPSELDVPTVGQQIFGTYLQDTIEVTDRWKTELGVRQDGYNFQIPTDPGSPPSIAAAAHQRLWEPHFDVSYLPDPRDTFRFGFGRTLAVPLPSEVGADVSRGQYTAFQGIPSFDNTTGKPAQYCGVHVNQQCSNYADQLYWLTRDYRFGSSSLEAPLIGATFTNMDISWSHEFRDGAAVKVTPFYRRGYNVVEQTAQIIGFNFNTGQPIYGDVAYSNDGIQKATGIELLYTKEVPIGLSTQLGATYISQFGNEPPGAFLQPAALALGTVYRSPDLSPLQINAAFNMKYKNGFRINPVIGFNVGYPFGAGYYTAIYCNGKPFIVPNSDLGNIFSQSPGFIDPLDPGSCTKPNIAATRGNHEAGLPGGQLTAPRVNVDITFEYSPNNSRSTLGLQIKNLLNQLYNVPVVNGCYGTPVTTGLATGSSPCTYNSPQYSQPDLSAHGTSPYLTYPNLTPITFRLYYQVKV